jgi:hypothetical protein
MNFVMRPGFLVAAWIVLAVGALVFLSRPLWDSDSSHGPQPRPVPSGDREIVWLANATNTFGWERFVTAIRRLAVNRLDLGIVVDERQAFPRETTAVPELALRLRAVPGQIWIRWYKITGEQNNAQWIHVLCQRTPPPLAIVGGASSDVARDIARALAKAQAAGHSTPVFLVTTATADVVDAEPVEGKAFSMGVEMTKIYAGKTFRFCYTNRQMAEAVTDFLWQDEALRPDAEPIYMTYWEDDPYSEDLCQRFRDVFQNLGYGAELTAWRRARAVAREWVWSAGRLGTGGVPVGLEFAGLVHGPFDEPGPFFTPSIPYSVGSFEHPNYWEEEAAEKILDAFHRQTEQDKPLLIVPAVQQPARRFLRAVVRIAPLEARRFVVATGDSLDMNVVYRDRLLNWPIQDLPFALVFFAHRNPVDPRAFEADDERAAPDASGRSSSGTHDLLLNYDIMEALAECLGHEVPAEGGAEALAERLRRSKQYDGRPRFDAQGNRPGGTGEFVVHLQPIREGHRVLPRAVLRVWYRHGTLEGRIWRKVQIAGRSELIVEYKKKPPIHRVGEGP